MNQGLIDYLSDCQRNKKIEAIDSYNSNYYNGIIFKAANSIYKVIDVTHAGPSALQKHAFIKNLVCSMRHRLIFVLYKGLYFGLPITKSVVHFQLRTLFSKLSSYI